MHSAPEQSCPQRAGLQREPTNVKLLSFQSRTPSPADWVCTKPQGKKQCTYSYKPKLLGWDKCVSLVEAALLFSADSWGQLYPPQNCHNARIQVLYKMPGSLLPQLQEVEKHGGLDSASGARETGLPVLPDGILVLGLRFAPYQTELPKLGKDLLRCVIQGSGCLSTRDCKQAGLLSCIIRTPTFAGEGD